MFTHKFPLKFQNPQIQLIFATVYSTIFYMMEEAIIEKTVAALRRNHFEVFIATDKEDAGRIFFNEIFPHLQVESVSWGDSETMKATGVLDELRKHPELAVINTFAPDMSRAQKIYWRRKALTADLFLSGSNAVTQKGQLVNLDMIGNRIGGIVFGPKQVVLFIGINKITEDLEAAMQRVRTIAAPRNAMRHEGFRTPCRKTGVCMDCNSPDRICNVWSITEKSFPAGRIKIVLIREKLGL